MRAGAAVFAVGAVAAMTALVPFLVGTTALPTWVYALSVLAPVGLGMILWGLWRSARRSSRAARARTAADR
jgi:hypothetical protein